MTQEEKQLLLKDLCARLTYGVICHYDCVIPIERREFHKANCKGILKGIVPMSNGHIGFMVDSDKVDALEGNIKPYLRPMSSMTEEERKIMKSCGFELIHYDTGHTGFANIENCIDEVSFRFMEEFLNAHYLDYRGLIPMGLALEASEGMYNIKQK